MARNAGNKGTIAGQVEDLEAESVPADEERLRFIHKNKTGALIVCALRIGAIAAKANPQQLHVLTEYAQHLGLAFQVADDVLDEIGTPENMGKEQGSDRATKKMTYVSLLGVEGALAFAQNLKEKALLCLEQGGLKSKPLELITNFIVDRKS